MRRTLATCDKPRFTGTPPSGAAPRARVARTWKRTLPRNSTVRGGACLISRASSGQQHKLPTVDAETADFGDFLKFFSRRPTRGVLWAWKSTSDPPPGSHPLTVLLVGLGLM